MTPEEEEIIFQQYDLHENKWSTIAGALERRRDNTIKNYFYATLRRKIRRICKLLRIRKIGKFAPKLFRRMLSRQTLFVYQEEKAAIQRHLGDGRQALCLGPSLKAENDL